MVETRADGLVSPVLDWPEWPFYLPGLVSLALWALVAAEQLRESLRHGRSLMGERELIGARRARLSLRPAIAWRVPVGLAMILVGIGGNYALSIVAPVPALRALSPAVQDPAVEQRRQLRPLGRAAVRPDGLSRRPRRAQPRPLPRHERHARPAPRRRRHGRGRRLRRFRRGLRLVARHRLDHGPGGAAGAAPAATTTRAWRRARSPPAARSAS